MPTSNMGPIQVYEGAFTNECTTEYDLAQNQAVIPEIRDFLDYVQGRQMVTLITNGSVTPYGINYKADVTMPSVESSSRFEGKGIGSNAYQFRIMGRIEQPATILEQVGSSGADGSFSLKMADRHLNYGEMVLFYGSRYTARVMSQPRASGNGYMYDFKSPAQEVFSWGAHVATQNGTYTCFGGWTSFGEKSLKGYGESKFPDMFVNHMTIQRNTVSMTGDALSRVLWYKFTDATGGNPGKGWIYEELAQQRVKFNVKNERQKKFGVSTMKNTDGSLRATPTMFDQETGQPIIAGDGIEMQIGSGNVLYASGSDGQPTLDNYATIGGTLKQNGNLVSGYTFYCLTGTVGYNNFQKIAPQQLGNQNVMILQAENQSDRVGGTMVNSGYEFKKININGDTYIICQDPMFDDALAFPERGADNKLIMSGTVFILNFGGMNGAPSKNIEILHKAANGVNRNMVEATLNGMTGSGMGTIISQEDAMSHAILKQDMINVYDTKTCAIIYPTN